MQIENVTAQSHGVLVRIAGDAAYRYFHDIEPTAAVEPGRPVSEYDNSRGRRTNAGPTQEWQGQYVDITG
ncbi:MAG: hypothetical protein ACLFUM_07480 [Spirochaetaceae bacterium]